MIIGTDIHSFYFIRYYHIQTCVKVRYLNDIYVFYPVLFFYSDIW